MHKTRVLTAVGSVLLAPLPAMLPAPAAVAQPQPAADSVVQVAASAPCSAISAGTVQAGPTGNGRVTSDTSDNWAGYVSRKGVGHSTDYASVEGTWVQPAIGRTTCRHATHSTWVGLGGFRTHRLLQAGTDQSNRAWFEYLGPNGTGVYAQFFNLTIRPGDTIHAVTSYRGGTATWTVTDVTTGKSAVKSLSNMSRFYDGSSAEFIDERDSSGPISKPVPGPLANFDETTWIRAKAATSAHYRRPVALSSLPNLTRLKMIDRAHNDRTLATTSALGASGHAFETFWKRCS